MRQHRLIVVLGGAFLVAGGFFAIACSTDNGTGTSSGQLPTVDSGSKTDSGSNNTGTDGSSGTDSGDNDGGVSADCSTAPQLRTNTNDFFCAFVDKNSGPGGDAGDPRYCKNTQICCNPSDLFGDGGHVPSYCADDPDKGTASGDTVCGAAAGSFDSAYTKGSTWECASKSNCPTGKVCCLTTAPDAGENVNIGKNLDNTIPVACDAHQAFKQGGTKCEDSCTAGTEIEMCSNDDQNCSGATKCTPFEGFFRDLGYCR